MSKCYTLGNFDGSTTLLASILNIYYPHSTFSEEEGSFDESQWEQNNLLDNTTCDRGANSRFLYKTIQLSEPCCGNEKPITDNKCTI